MTDPAVPFVQRQITFANGSRGEALRILSGNPRNYHQLVSDPASIPPVEIGGLLFRPPGVAPSGLPGVVVVVPGSLSVAPSHLRHAETFTGMGLAALVLDPFGARNVVSTVADQTQYSFAASAFDVICTMRALRSVDGIDAGRLGLQGHSRGGSAVLSAAMTALNGGHQPKAVLAAYPWCGHQPLQPHVGASAVRVLIGDRDDWCSAQQAQGFVQAMRLCGGRASIRIVAGAGHSFDRNEAISLIADARVSPGAPTTYLDGDGSFIHPATGEADPDLVDRDLMVYGIKAGYGVTGAHIGGDTAQAELFTADMVEFFRREL